MFCLIIKTFVVIRYSYLFANLVVVVDTQNLELRLELLEGTKELGHHQLSEQKRLPCNFNRDRE